MELRDYQKECVDIINGLESGSYLVVMATGLGKTVTFSSINRRGRMLIISHREELVYQPKKYFDCSYGVEIRDKTSNGEEVVSASLLSLVNRLDRFKPDDFDIIITDEAHHAVAKSYRTIYDYFKPRLHLGFTATPNRADNVKLGEIFSKIIFDRDIKWGIENGYLANIRCMVADVGYKLNDVRSRMGDFMQNDLERALNIEECNQTVAEVYHKQAIGKTLIFCATKKHCESLAEFIPEAEVITESTKNRSEVLDRFAHGDLNVLINCLVLTEGTDLPMIQTIIMCRPTQNVSLYVQAVGRGLRLFDKKEDLLLIDCVGASSLPICTAPVLFGLDNDVKPKEGERLTDVDKRIKEEKFLQMQRTTPWKVNISMVDLFEKKGKYDTHDVNYTIIEDGEMVCSLGDGIIIVINPEDMVGNSFMTIQQWDKMLLKTEPEPMQKVLDKAYNTLKNSYATNVSLWNRNKVKEWGSNSVSEKQVFLLKKLYSTSELNNVDFKTLTKCEASCMISRRLPKSGLPAPTPGRTNSRGQLMATEKQIEFLENLLTEEEQEEFDLENLTKKQACELIDRGVQRRNAERAASRRSRRRIS